MSLPERPGFLPAVCSSTRKGFHTTSKVTDPVVLGAKPAHGGVFTEEIELHFSEPVTVAPGEPGVNLYDCGDDFGCGTDDDGLIARYDSLPNATNGTGGKGPVLLTYDGAKVHGLEIQEEAQEVAISSISNHKLTCFSFSTDLHYRL